MAFFSGSYAQGFIQRLKIFYKSVEIYRWRFKNLKKFWIWVNTSYLCEIHKLYVVTKQISSKIDRKVSFSRENALKFNG